MGAQCARKRHRLGTEHEKLAAVVGGANTRVNWGLDNPKFSWRGTDARFFCVSAGAAWRGSIPRDFTFHCQFVAMLLGPPSSCNCFIFSLLRHLVARLAKACDVTQFLGPKVERRPARSASVSSGQVTTVQ